MSIEIDIGLLKEFEEGLDTLHPERSRVPAKIIGYGEISTVFQIGQSDFVYKRMPVFDNEEQVIKYESIYRDYNEILKSAGLNLPEFGGVRIITDDGRFVFYDVQQKLSEASIGNKVIYMIDDEKIKSLVLLVIKELKKIMDFNNKNEDLKIGIDGQISNWAIADFEVTNPIINKKTKLIYLLVHH